MDRAMISRFSGMFVLFIALVGCGSNEKTPKFTTVRVLIDGENCLVDARQMRCDVVAAYMKNERHLRLSESVFVEPEGTGHAALARGETVRTRLRAAGYSDILSVGFLTSPDHPNPDP
jgi:hypothetical protein